MASTTTSELGLSLPVVGTREPFVPATINANWNAVDAQFNATAGHDHSGAHKGKLIPITAIVQPLHLTAPVVDTSGLTIAAGGLTVSAGNIGIGSAPVAQAALHIPNALTITSSGGSATGLNVTPTLTFGNNNDSAFGIFVNTPITPAGRTGTSAYAVYIAGPQNATLNNYGLYITAPAGGSGVNAAIRATGDCIFGNGTGQGTTDTTGYLMMSGSGGAATGVPTNASLGFAIRYNSATNQIQVYNGGWRSTVALS